MARAALIGVLSVTCVLCASTPRAWAQVEVFGSLTASLDPPAGTFETDYAPKLVYGTVTGGRGTHVLTLDATGRAGFDVGLNWLPNRRAGLQLFLERAHHTLTGANVNYELALDYLARVPPDYMELPYRSAQSLSWPDTTGDMAVWRVGTNGIARFSGRWADLTVSGGLVWTRVRGTFEPVGYYEYRLGGHSTLFYNDVLLDMTFDDSWHVGFDAGADAGFKASTHVAFTVGIRFVGPAPEPNVIIGEPLTFVAFEVPRADIEAALGDRATFDRWGSPALRFGVRLGF